MKYHFWGWLLEGSILWGMAGWLDWGLRDFYGRGFYVFMLYSIIGIYEVIGLALDSLLVL